MVKTCAVPKEAMLQAAEGLIAAEAQVGASPRRSGLLWLDRLHSRTGPEAEQRSEGIDRMDREQPTASGPERAGMKQFATDLLSGTCPARWTAIEHKDGSGVILASSESSLDRYGQGASFESGDQALNISLAPAELFQTLQIAIEPSASAGELSEALLTKLGEIDGTEAGAPEIVAFEDGREVAIRRAANDRTEGAVILFAISDRVIALNTVLCHLGEYGAAEATALAILSSLTFGGTAEALTAAIDPVPPVDFPIQ
jgi:hypothetical protein